MRGRENRRVEKERELRGQESLGTWRVVRSRELESRNLESREVDQFGELVKLESSRVGNWRAERIRGFGKWGVERSR